MKRRFLTLLALVGLTLFLTGADSVPHMNSKVCGDDEAHCADVILQDGVKRLSTTGLVQIDQLLGQYPKATGWFFIGTESDSTGVGAAGDIVTVTIPAGVNPEGSTCNAVDVDTTVTSAMVADDNPEIALATQIVTNLNTDSNFRPCWKAIRMKNFSGVFIESDFFNSFGVRNTWSVSATGTTVVTQGNDDLVVRGLVTELQQSPNDPRQGQLGIAGSLQLTPGGANDLFVERAEDTGGSDDMTVDGSTTTQTYCIDAVPDQEKIVQYLTFSGTDNGIKYAQFLGNNAALTNGVLVRFKSEDEVGQFEPIVVTDDFEDSWANVPSDFSLAVQSGGDHFNGTKDLTASSLVLARTGAFDTDDYICIDIRDDLTGLIRLNFRAKGFLRQP